MSDFNGCYLPDELHYSVENNVWIRVLENSNVEIGLTDIAQSMAGNVIHCLPKKQGKKVKKNKSVATVESGKWVGPVKSPFSGEVAESNDLVASEPMLLNLSPYKRGWIVRLSPDNFAADMAELVQGEEAVAGFKSYMAEKGFEECLHNEGYEK